MTLHEINKRINYLKNKLSSTDYKAIKYAEGIISEEDYAIIKEERQSYRNEIEQLRVQRDLINLQSK